MSVNVSACQLREHDFIGDVRAALSGSGLPASSLVLEVTESVLVADIERIGAVMAKIQELGVQMALDDFGTGYSSLLYLKGLPIDRLKVDRSFVAGLGSPGQDPTIVSTVVELAREHQITQIVVGATRRSRWEEMSRGSIVRKLLRFAAESGIDVHVIARRDASLELSGGRDEREQDKREERRAERPAMAKEEL